MDKQESFTTVQESLISRDRHKTAPQPCPSQVPFRLYVMSFRLEKMEFQGKEQDLMAAYISLPADFSCVHSQYRDVTFDAAGKVAHGLPSDGFRVSKRSEPSLNLPLI